MEMNVCRFYISMNYRCTKTHMKVFKASCYTKCDLVPWQLIQLLFTYFCLTHCVLHEFIDEVVAIRFESMSQQRHKVEVSNLIDMHLFILFSGCCSFGGWLIYFIEIIFPLLLSNSSCIFLHTYLFQWFPTKTAHLVSPRKPSLLS